MWNRIKIFFRDSETIFLARLQMLVGFVVAAATAMDWGPLIGMASGGGFDKDQLISLAVILFVQGVAIEYMRRRRADDM